VAWLDADLAAARKDPDIDWIFVMMHHGVYSASNHGSTDRVQSTGCRSSRSTAWTWSSRATTTTTSAPCPLRGAGRGQPEEGVVYVVAGGFFSPGYGNGHEWWTATSTHGDVRNYVRSSTSSRSRADGAKSPAPSPNHHADHRVIIIGIREFPRHRGRDTSAV
jgi:hypothetical protein